jgi:hypothetical protein
LAMVRLRKRVFIHKYPMVSRKNYDSFEKKIKNEKPRQ